jgi:hypothetical protein
VAMADLEAVNITAVGGCGTRGARVYRLARFFAAVPAVAFLAMTAAAPTAASPAARPLCVYALVCCWAAGDKGGSDTASFVNCGAGSGKGINVLSVYVARRRRRPLWHCKEPPLCLCPRLLLCTMCCHCLLSPRGAPAALAVAALAVVFAALSCRRSLSCTSPTRTALATTTSQLAATATSRFGQCPCVTLVLDAAACADI